VYPNQISRAAKLCTRLKWRDYRLWHASQYRVAEIMRRGDAGVVTSRRHLGYMLLHGQPAYFRNSLWNVISSVFMDINTAVELQSPDDKRTTGGMS